MPRLRSGRTRKPRQAGCPWTAAGFAAHGPVRLSFQPEQPTRPWRPRRQAAWLAGAIWLPRLPRAGLTAHYDPDRSGSRAVSDRIGNALGQADAPLPTGPKALARGPAYSVSRPGWPRPPV